MVNASKSNTHPQMMLWERCDVQQRHKGAISCSGRVVRGDFEKLKWVLLAAEW
jgi:hypothetical protein